VRLSSTGRVYHYFLALSEVSSAAMRKCERMLERRVAG